MEKLQDRDFGGLGQQGDGQRVRFAAAAAGSCGLGIDRRLRATEVGAAMVGSAGGLGSDWGEASDAAVCSTCGCSLGGSSRLLRPQQQQLEPHHLPTNLQEHYDGFQPFLVANMQLHFYNGRFTILVQTSGRYAIGPW